MAKRIVLVVLLVAMCFGLCACGNYDVWDTVYTYDEAILELADGTIVRGRVQQWCDYEGEQLQVKIDGVTYLVNSVNATLIAK